MLNYAVKSLMSKYAVMGLEIMTLYAYRIMFESYRKCLRQQCKQWKRKASNSCIVVCCLCVVEDSVASHTEETSSYEKSA